MSTYKTHSTTNPYLERVRKHKKPYTHKILGKEILIYPNVMSPKYDWSPQFHIENMPSQKGKKVLEIGCGSGVISLFASFQGAKNVTAIDINKNALENTKANFQKHNIQNCKIFYSDVFKNVKEKFDTITFAAPYHGNKPKDILEFGVSDPNYKALKDFFNGARNHLSESGQVVLGFSNTGDLDLLNKLIIENKFFLKERIEKTNNGWTAYLYILEPIHFDSQKQEYIYNDDYFYFQKYTDLIKSGKILKVGSGLGYSSNFISLFNKDLTTLEINGHSNKLVEKITKYDGVKIPFKDNSFDCVICTYVLHHSRHRDILLKELFRVSKYKIIIVEETYNNIVSKIFLMLNDWLSNRKANQNVTIIPGSYFKRRELESIFSENKLKIVKHEIKNKYNFQKEFFIVKK